MLEYSSAAVLSSDFAVVVANGRMAVSAASLLLISERRTKTKRRICDPHIPKMGERGVSSLKNYIILLFLIGQLQKIIRNTKMDIFSNFGLTFGTRMCIIIMGSESEVKRCPKRKKWADLLTIRKDTK